METESKTPSLAARGSLKAIFAYQSIRHGQVSPCRFTPSCSAYAAEAIETYGFLTGTRLAIWRVLRCNPFGNHGVDLVPLKTGASR